MTTNSLDPAQLFEGMNSNHIPLSSGCASSAMKNPSVQGNLTSDSRWDYVWDAENRLEQMPARETAVTVGAPNLRLRFAYD